MAERLVLGYKYQTVAANLNVDLSTVWRVVKLFQNFETVDKKYYSRSVSQKLTPPLELRTFTPLCYPERDSTRAV